MLLNVAASAAIRQIQDAPKSDKVTNQLINARALK
jgi:hypothetical protein